MKLEFNGEPVFIGQGGMRWKARAPTLVLLHGAGMNRTVWVLQARYFARHGFNVVAPDLPGHGASGGKPLESIDAQADWLLSLLDTLAADHQVSLQRRILAGHSMGALTVLQAAATRPRGLARLLLFGCAWPMPVGQALLDAAAANDSAAIDMITIFSHAYASRLGHNPVAGISLLNTAAALLQSASPGVLHTDLCACNEYDNGGQAASLLQGQVRSVVIAGDGDRMTPLKGSRKLSDQLAAERVLMPDCGHMMMAEQPEAALQLMRRELSGIACGSAAAFQSPGQLL